MKTIRITAAAVTMDAELNDSKTAKMLWDVLPVESSANRWGQEVYFETPLKAPPENTQAAVPSGTIAYWPDGCCFCIFFGQRPYSPVNPLGNLKGNASEFDKVKEGDKIRIERVE